GASECPPVEGKNRVECESPFGEPLRQHLRELTRWPRTGTVETVAGDAQALARDLELDAQQVELGEAVAHLPIARADDEQNSIGACEDLSMAARERGWLAAFLEQESDIADDERRRARERLNRRRERARLRELVDRLPRLGRREQYRWPTRPAHEPPLEQLSERAVAGGAGTDEPEQ